MLSALMLVACVGLGAIVHSQGTVIYWLPYNSIEKQLPMAVLYLHVKPLWMSDLRLL